MRTAVIDGLPGDDKMTFVSQDSVDEYSCTARKKVALRTQAKTSLSKGLHVVAFGLEPAT